MFVTGHPPHIGILQSVLSVCSTKCSLILKGYIVENPRWVVVRAGDGYQRMGVWCLAAPAGHGSETEPHGGEICGEFLGFGGGFGEGFFFLVLPSLIKG